MALTGLVVASCATTAGSRHAGAPSGASATTPTSAGAQGSVATTPPASGATRAGETGSRQGAGAQNGTVGPTPGGTTNAPHITSRQIPADAAGVSPTRIHIGVNLPTPSSGAAVAGAFGAKGVASGDFAPEVRAIFAYINAHGGVAGRAIVPVIQYTDVTQGAYDAQAQATCSYFTTDNRVFAVAQLVNDQSIILPSCLADHHVALLDAQQSLTYDRQAIMEFAGAYYSPDRLTLDRYGGVIKALGQQGYFDRGAKIGLVIYDLPQYRRMVDQAAKPALAALGLSLADTYALPPPTSTSAITDLSAQIQNAILRFKGERINHVIFAVGETSVPFLWMPAAESQGYRPRYGLTSSELPNFLQQNDPPTQLARAVAVGWNRVADLGSSQSWNDTSQIRQCVDAVRATGMTDPSVEYEVGCDPFFLLQAALNSATIVSISGLRSAVDHLGAAFQYAGAPGTSFGPNQYDGIGAYRDLPFVGACACFEYSGSSRPLPT